MAAGAGDPRSIRGYVLGVRPTYNGARLVTVMETTTEMSRASVTIPFLTGQGPCSAGQAAAVIRAVAAVASPDMARGVLAGVHVESDGDSVRFTATDSYRLLTVAVPVGENAVVFDPFTLSAKELAAAAKNVKRSDVCRIEYVAGQNAATFSNGVDSFRVPTCVGTFADWRRLIPTDPVWPTAGETVNMDPVLLAGLLDSFVSILAGGGRSRKHGDGVTFSQVLPNKVSLMTAAGVGFTATGLIMPLRK